MKTLIVLCALALAGIEFPLDLRADVIGHLGRERPEALGAVADIGLDAALDGLARFQRRIAGTGGTGRLCIALGLLDRRLHAGGGVGWCGSGGIAAGG